MSYRSALLVLQQESASKVQADSAIRCYLAANGAVRRWTLLGTMAGYVGASLAGDDGSSWIPSWHNGLVSAGGAMAGAVFGWILASAARRDFHRHLQMGIQEYNTGRSSSRTGRGPEWPALEWSLAF